MSAHAFSRDAARRIVAAAVAAEIARLRDPALAPVGAGDWLDALPLGDAGLGLDSIERIGALGALAETFDLDDAALPAETPQYVGDWLDVIIRHHASSDGRIVVMTSGSTGRPQPHAHALADLLDEAAFFAERLPACRRVVALVPAHHLYGLIWTALLPDVLGVPVVARTLGAPLALAAGDLVVAVPDQWKAMLRITRRFPTGIVGVSSAAPLDDHLTEDLMAAGLSRLVEIYGSSETSAIGWRELPAPTFTLLPRWHWLPDNGADWRIADDRGTAQSLPDHVERIGERALRPIGRRDGVVQVGGHNVSPTCVGEILRTVGGVADAAVRLHYDGRLKAFIVPETSNDPAALATLIQQRAAARLTVHEQPRHFRFGTALPRNAMGKLEDWS